MARQKKKTTTAQSAPDETALQADSQPKSRASKRIEQITRLLQELDESALEYIATQVAMLVQQQRNEQTQQEVTSAQDSILHGEAPSGSKGPGYAVDIEQISPQSFVIQVAGERVYFSRDELRAVTKIAWGTDEPVTGAERLFRWFDRERRDFLLDTGIDGVRDRALEELYAIIRSRYRAK